MARRCLVAVLGVMEKGITVDRKLQETEEKALFAREITTSFLLKFKEAEMSSG